MKFSDLRKNLKKDFSGCKPIRLAIVADWSIQMLSQAIRGYGFEVGFDVQIYEATYDQMESEILNPQSELYTFEAEYVLLFPCVEKFQEKFYKSPELDRKNVGIRELARVKNLCDNISQNSQAKILLCNYCEIDDGVYGNYAGSFKGSLLYAVRKLNLELLDVIEEAKCYLVDINALQSCRGRENCVDNRLYYISKIVFSMDTLFYIAQRICAVMFAMAGKVNKCMVVDLDNTLWGGVIGDDGISGIQVGDLGIGKVFSDIQVWIKELSKRGIAIAVCSKNNAQTAREPFEKHSDMVLRLEDISVFMANWEDKATNIYKIKEILNIGTDSIVFIDDNPFERSLVLNMLPEVFVPELPKEPAEYLAYLKSLNLFETVGISVEDKIRTKQYQEEAKRTEMKNHILNLEEYLMGLEMTAQVKAFDKFSVPRVAQLTQRSNQFNLRTKRYSEAEIEKISKNHEKYTTMAISLKDRFGNYGIIGVVILEKTAEDRIFIDTLLMSCRVLKRSVEEFVFNEIVKIARSKGVKFIEGQYLPTSKNVMVADLLEKHGFVKEQKNCLLSIDEYMHQKTFVNIEEGEWS